VQEKILIELAPGQWMEVILVETAQGRARIGFKAPHGIRILRAELVEEVQS
jgi:sRNA-binding carbon storage regulator CsrA